LGLSGVYDPDGLVGTAWAGTATDRAKTEIWRTVIGKYITLCSTTRKDCIAVVDGLRTICLAGSQKIVRQGNNATVDIHILANLKNITGINSNYATMNINWIKYIDTFTGVGFWVPPSILSDGIIIYTDRTANYWDAPAGLNRGILYNAVDIAFNPTGKQQDFIYSKSFNYALNYPYDGIILEGQKTLQVKPSAFDRINVRRLFLKLERFTYKTARYYVNEPNNIFTRTRLVDQLTPIFEDVKTRGGIYDYRIICDLSNNTPTSIDNNELRLAVLIKPTKTAEFIICDFYNLATGTSFSEVSIQ
jgi:phage tail sheath protein FI